MGRLRRESGLSLIEVTIMLLVLMLLSGVLAPTIIDYVKDAQWVKVKEDCEAIGVSIARMMRDVPPCLRQNGTLGCTKTNRTDLLYSDGAVVGLGGTAAATPYSLIGATNGANASYNWVLTGGGAVSNVGSMEAHFTSNAPLYPLPSALGFFPVGPQFGLGWRGAYLSPPIGPDPWGSPYLVNTVFLSPATNATDASAEGFAGTAWDRDVFCISPGPNRLYETYFGGCSQVSPVRGGTCREGDDWTYVIQGGTR
jgi:hypothetical protein